MVTIPGDAIIQPNESLSGQSNGSQQWLVSFKGPYASLRAAALKFKPGDLYNGGGTARGILSTWQLSHFVGDHGTLTLNLAPADAASEDGDVGDSELKKDVWSVHGVRNDKSLLGFCGGSESTGGHRCEIEAWLKEPDAALAKEYQYRDSNDEVQSLTDGSRTIAQKFEKGIDSVMRFYPLITRKRTYSREPPAVLENLSKIDTPPVPATTGWNGTTRVPTGLSTIVGQYEWLKCQDDADENDDGSWTRTEAWMGAKSWDEDLYGKNPGDPWND